MTYLEIEDGWDNREILEINCSRKQAIVLVDRFFELCGKNNLVGDFLSFLEKMDIPFKKLDVYYVDLCLRMKYF